MSKQFLQKRKKQGLMQRAEKSRAVVSEKDDFRPFIFAVSRGTAKNKKLWEL